MLTRRLRNVLQRSLSFLILWAPLTNNVHADEIAPQSYHIEMIIFERLDSSFNAPEFWRKDFGLAYPPDYRIITPVTTLLGLETEGAQLALTDIDNSASIEPIHSAEMLKHPRVLPERASRDYILNEQAKVVSGRNKMRVLFHKAWQQALLPTTKSPYVVITGGDTFDNHHELGGTIRFSVNKFIHVDTKLWFTQFTPNYGQASPWPDIPPEPTLHFTAAERTLDSNSQLNNIAQAIDYGINQTSINNATDSDLFKNNVYSGSHLEATNGDIFRKSSSNSKASAQYLPNEIIVLEQSRRMRSKELHYIDHPRLGILVKIIPLSFEEAEKLKPSAE